MICDIIILIGVIFPLIRSSKGLKIMNAIGAIFENILSFNILEDWKLIVMWAIGGLLIYLAIA